MKRATVKGDLHSDHIKEPSPGAMPGWDRGGNGASGQADAVVLAGPTPFDSGRFHWARGVRCMLAERVRLPTRPLDSIRFPGFSPECSGRRGF